MDKNNEALNLIISLGSNYGSYHHHKELMAFRIVIIYLLGATALVIQGELFWSNFRNSFELAFVAIAIILSAVGAFKYVRWQLKNRQIAADMVAACTNLAIHLVASPENEREMEPTSLKDGDWIHPDSQLPKALVDEYEHIKKRGGSAGRPVFSRNLTYFLMIIWTVAVLVISLSQYINK